MKQTNLTIALVMCFVAASVAVLSLFSIKVSIAFALAAIVVGGTFASPFFGLLVYILLVYIRPQEFIPFLEKSRIMMSMGVLVLLSIVVHNSVENKKTAAAAAIQHLLMLALMLMVPASHLANFRFSEVWNSFAAFVPITFLFFLVVSLVDSMKRLRAAAWAIIVATVALAVNGIIQFNRGFDLLGVPLVAGRVRWVGAFENPNDLALLMNVCIPLVVFELFQRRSIWLKRLALIAMLASIILAIYYTNSRGGYISLLVMLVWLLIKWMGAVKGTLFGILALAMGVIVTPSRMNDLSPYGESASDRIYAWINGLAMLKTHPVFGIGFQQFAMFNKVAAHSAFVQLFAELGLVGYYIWLALIYVCLRDLRISERLAERADCRTYAQILQVSFIGFLGSATFLSQAYNPVLYVLIALSVATVRISLGASRVHFSLKDAAIVSGALVLSIVLYKMLAILYI